MLRRFFITFCMVVVVVIVFSSIVTQKRDKRRTLEIRQETLVEKIAFFKKRNYELEKENDALINDPIQIEREARESFGYIKPGETTYRKYKFSISEPENRETKQSSILRKMDSFLFEGPFPWQVPLGIITIATIFLLISYRYER
jgi:cell division protein FtsB